MPPFKRKFVPAANPLLFNDVNNDKVEECQATEELSDDFLSKIIQTDHLDQSDNDDSDNSDHDSFNTFESNNMQPVFGESEDEDANAKLNSKTAEKAIIHLNNINASKKLINPKFKLGKSRIKEKKIDSKIKINEVPNNTEEKKHVSHKDILNKNTENSETNNTNEYAHDSSDEEDIRNTVGNIPMNWYDDFPHLGYDWDGKKIFKPQSKDQLDEFLSKMEDPNYWRMVKDLQTGQNVFLSDADVELIKRVQSGQIPDKNFNDYAPWIDWFSCDVLKMPIKNDPNHKRSYLPSKSDYEKVAKLVHALKKGWIKTEEEKTKERQEKKQLKFYMLWRSDDTAERIRRIHNHIPAPKRLLPGHAESYNPPSEYLFDKKEMKEWKKQTKLQQKKKLHFLPQKYNSLREVPAYDKFIYERFQRCLDLYLCPRGRKMRLTIEPEDLVPKLPSPKDLQPFPTVLSIVYKGHTDMVRTLVVDAKGQYLASGSDDMTVRVWEISTGRCLKTFNCGGIVRSISWCPSQSISLILVAADKKVLLINSGVGDSLVTSKTDLLLEKPPESDIIVSDRVKAVVQWEAISPTSQEWLKGIRIILNHFKEVTQVTWHGRGDYFSAVMPEGSNRSVIIHQLSKRRSQIPFNKSKGLIQCVLFHPIKPILFVATQKNIRIYDLMKQELIKKLLSNSKWISSMAIHPGGDNLLVGTYDSKILWFDLDLSTEPYQILRLHYQAVRSVAFHKRYPLFASGSDDKNVIISHGMVYNDLLQNPLIVPLKKLSHHETHNDFGVLSVVFHPTQPWLFSSGADGKIFLYT